MFIETMNIKLVLKRSMIAYGAECGLFLHMSQRAMVCLSENSVSRT